jgi:hypothetical protein
MNNFALGENGAEVMMATANDDNFPSENMLDGKEDTFWTTTGLFPHEVVIKLAKRESISKVRHATTAHSPPARSHPRHSRLCVHTVLQYETPREQHAMFLLG